MSSEANLAGVSIGVAEPVRIMAALNVSPESFYPGSVWRDEAALRDAAQEAVAEGADVIDVGAMSTAPYLQARVPVEEEVRRMTWAVAVLGAAVSVPISADTTRAAAAAAALAAGARIVNDVTGLRGDHAMADVAAQAEGVIVVASALHEPGAGSLALVRSRLREGMERAEQAGIAAQRVVVDPGIGFFPHALPSPAAFNCALLRELAGLSDLGRPLLVGVSRKSFIGTLTGRADPSDRLAGSLGATAIAVYNGASMIRTHDVAATRDVVRVAQAIRNARA